MKWENYCDFVAGCFGGMTQCQSQMMSHLLRGTAQPQRPMGATVKFMSGGAPDPQGVFWCRHRIFGNQHAAAAVQHVFSCACGVLVAHPLDTIKVWQQASNSSVLTAVHQIYSRNNGINGFYRGMFFPFISTGAINSLLFGIYGNHLRQLRKVCHSDYQREQLEYHNMFMAGSVAGFVQSFIACPMELIKVRLQTACYYNDYLYGQRRTAFGTFKRILKTDGISGLYRGLLPMMCRDVLPYGIYMLAYRQSVDYLDGRDFVRRRRSQADGSSVNLLVTTLAGAWAGVISWVCVIPFDVVKTLMQADENHKFRGIFHCVRVNYRAYGWRSIFRGSWMLVARAIPFNAATFLGYEYALEWCQRWNGTYV